MQTEVVCGDGAMGTLLLDSKMPAGVCLEELCLRDPDRISAIHEEYIAAGARVVKTNSFGANAVRLERFGLEERVAEINLAAVRIARQAARGKEVLVAGSVGPLGISAAEADARGIDRSGCFREQISALLEGGADWIFFETFTDADEMTLAFRVKQELSRQPAICVCLRSGWTTG